ncbi:MAG: preprotein translocase subunit SecG [Ruminococcaceae bacterium]|nr:preprotein translocase subunit SecG [Oscillospiraceae bacterium]
MATLKTILYVVQIIVSLALIVTVLLQDGNSYGLSGSISGGADTFFGKGKSKSLDGIFKLITKISAGLFLVLSLVLVFLTKF